jgi:adenylate kinase family enzyme
MKILIFGMPETGKTTLAEPFNELLNGVYLNEHQIRNEYINYDYSIEGRTKNAEMLRFLADGVVKAGKVAVIDCVAATPEIRKIIDADYTVWMDTIKTNKNNDNLDNRMNVRFQEPNIDEYNYHVSKWFNDTPEQLRKVFQNFQEIQKNIKKS